MPFQKIPCPNCGYERFMTVFVTNHVIETKTCPKCHERIRIEYTPKTGDFDWKKLYRKLSGSEGPPALQVL